MQRPYRKARLGGPRVGIKGSEMAARYSPKDTDAKDMINVNTVLVMPSIAYETV